MFEDAARSPERCEGLIRKYRRGRALAFFLAVFTLIGVLLVGSWFLVHALHSLQAVADGRSGYKSAASLDPNLIKVVLAPIIGWSIVNGIFLFQADAMVKMLLMVRILQNSGPAQVRD